MKKPILFTTALVAAISMSAQRWDNYRPDYSNVSLRQTNLPIIFINTNSQVIDKDNRIVADMIIINNGEGALNYKDTINNPGQNIDYRGKIGLKYRGNSSFYNSDKKPYSIKTQDEWGKNNKVPLLGMGKDHDWALLAPYSDKSMMRDMLSFTLGRRYFEFVPQGRYCELILDNIYYGVYIMTERVRKGKQRINVSDPGEEGDALTGGYILEIDRDDEPVYTSKYAPTDKYGNKIWGKTISFQYKAPEYDELTPAQKGYITKHIDDFENALASANFKDPGKGYRKYIDQTSFIDYLLSTEFAHNVDGYRLSTFIYKYRDSIDPRFKMSLWDFNLGFGNADYADGWRTDTWAYNFNDVAPWDNPIMPFWWYRFMEDPDFVESVKLRWTTYRKTAYSNENITAVIDSMYNVLNCENAQKRNFAAWPRWNQYVWPNKYVASSYDDEIDYLKRWINERLEFMDDKLLTKDVSVLKHRADNKINVYCNNKKIYVNLMENSGNIIYTDIINTAGTIVLKHSHNGNDNIVIDADRLPCGIYIMNYRFGNKNGTYKINIQ